MCALGGDEHRVGHAARRDEEAPLAEAMLLAVHVHQQLPGEHVDGLVLGMRVQWRALSPDAAVLHQQERAAGLRSARLDREHPAAGEPQVLALARLSNDRNGVAHGCS